MRHPQRESGTGGAFDAAIGALVDCWRGPDGNPRTPSDDEVADARARSGTDLVVLDVMLPDIDGFEVVLACTSNGNKLGHNRSIIDVPAKTLKRDA